MNTCGLTTLSFSWVIIYWGIFLVLILLIIVEDPWRRGSMRLKRSFLEKICPTRSFSQRIRPSSHFHKEVHPTCSLSEGIHPNRFFPEEIRSTVNSSEEIVSSRRRYLNRTVVLDNPPAWSSCTFVFVGCECVPYNQIPSSLWTISTSFCVSWVLFT